MTEVSRETIRHAVADLALSEDVITRLDAHWQLVSEWNQRTNLTAITEIREAAWLHYRDSLEALSVIPQGRIIDVGSGAGFPGVPIAAADPDRETILVEPRRKRASFLEVVVARLGLKNVRVVVSRVQDPPAATGTVVTRATFSDEDDIHRCLEWVAPGGALVAFRSDPGDLEPDETRWYDLRQERRCLLIWRR